MSWRIATQHRSVYHYAEPVVTSFNEARLTPTNSQRQSVISSSLLVDPPGPRSTYLDYWSSAVVAFEVEQRHDSLTVIGSSLVETSATGADKSGCPWEELRGAEVQDRFAELLMPTAYTVIDAELAAVARAFAAGPAPKVAVDGLSCWVREAMRYEAGTTEVSTSALQAWRQRSGVCQDFAHLTIALLRLAGIPARYVSGYVHPNADAVVGQTVVGDSHAWVEAWIGSWYAFDPTNGAPVAERHVTVAHGRDYADAAPLRGVYQGGALDRLEVRVELTRMA